MKIPSTAVHVRLEDNAPPIGKRNGILKAPVFDRTKPALAYFRLRNNGKDVPEDYITFGQAFAPGALSPSTAVAVMFGDGTLPVQLDVKSLHSDGSVRHGVVTLLAPPLSGGEELDGRIVASETSQATAFDAAIVVRKKFTLPHSLRFYFANADNEDVAGDVRDEAMKAFAAQSAGWLSGPFVVERRVEREITPHLKLRADIRVYRDGDIRTSLAFVNDKSFAPGRRDALYDVRIGNADTPALVVEKLAHHRASNWRRVFWTGKGSRFHIVHDIEGLTDAGAILPFDASLGVNAAEVSKKAARLQDLPPLSPALIQQYMPTTGGRDDIGVVPVWTANYLVAQTETAKRIMLANADAAGAVPWHYADDKTGAPLSIEDYPDFWADRRGLQKKFGSDRPHADIFESSDGGWRPDHAHKPALTAVPWLVTGERYYADELAMQGAWAIFGQSPKRRAGVLKAIDIGQVRESAWSLRDLSDAAYLLPDAHPSKLYLKRVLKKNLATMANKYVHERAMRAAGEMEGFIEEPYLRNKENISPWQNEFLAVSLWLAARRGMQNAEDLMAWSSKFHAERFLHDDFDWRFAVAYHLPVKNAGGELALSRWANLSDKTHARVKETPNGFVGHQSLADGYIGSAAGALSAIANQTQSPAAFDALGFWLRETRDYRMWEVGRSGGIGDRHGFFFALIAPSGAHYARRNIRWNGGGDGDNNLVVGLTKGGTLNGGSGADIILGLGGDDKISGGEGDDYLSAGGGSDELTGGEGADIFAIAGVRRNNVVITDFDPFKDKVYFGASFALDKRNLMNSLIDTPQGARLNFQNDKGALLLKGMTKNALSEQSFAAF